LSDVTGNIPTSLAGQARALLSGQRDRIANAANLASLLFHELEDVNWVGFYFMRGGELVVGPFQGKPACVSIPLGSGVCGTAAASREAQLVPESDRCHGPNREQGSLLHYRVCGNSLLLTELFQ
jgi:putative methionine-R-sulfoxide reductase with GAF domain